MAPGGRATPRRLPRGGTALDPQTVERVHRERLRAAVVELISAQGYTATTVEDLTATAGLSTTGFYALYRNKRECVVDAWDALLAELDGELAAAAERAQAASETTSAGLRAQLCEVIGVLCDAAVRRPAATQLLLQEAGSLGADGPARRHQVVEALQRHLDHATSVPITPVAAATVAAGTVAVVEQRLRTGKQRSLRSAAPDLATWGAGYDLAPAGTTAEVAGSSGESTPGRSGLMTLPQGVHRLPRSFVDRHQRARILQAVRELTAEHGYEDLTLSQLTAQARISNRTFYEHFTDLKDAFLVAFQEAFTDLFARAYYGAAARESWSAAVTAGIAALAEAMSDSPETARFVLHDARSAGRTIGDAADEALGAFATLLTRGRSGARVPAVVPYAIVAGITSVAGDRVVNGHADQLPELTPQLCYLALAPFVGDGPAREAAGLSGAEGKQDDRSASTAAAAPLPLGTGDQLEPIYAAFLELVEEQGFEHTRLDDVARRADVDLALVQDAFLETTYLAAAVVDDAADSILAAMADAFISGGDDLALATHRALGAMLGALAAAPVIAQLAVRDLRSLDETTDTRRERFFGMFGDVIGSRLPVLPPQPEVVLHIIADGLVELVGRYAADDRLDELMRSLPEISLRSLTPFFGAAEAARVATLPVPVAPAPRRS
jgi:AcrR family transcriptional regulator